MEFQRLADHPSISTHGRIGTEGSKMNNPAIIRRVVRTGPTVVEHTTVTKNVGGG